jgi:hypothetical protein
MPKKVTRIRTMKTKTFATCLLVASTLTTALASANCRPESNTLGLWTNIHSYHLSRENVVNEENQLLGLQWNRWFAGTFSNSFYQRSYVLGWCWLRGDWAVSHSSKWSVTAKLSPGIAYGYGNRFLLSFWNLTPGLLPSAGFNYDVNEQLTLGAETFYVWSEQGGVLVTGLNASWHF